MDRNDVHARLTEIFSDVMDIDNPVLAEGTTANDIEEWDSLSHVRLIVAVERRFKIKFNNAEIENMKCVGDLLTAIVAKAG